jgi:hypothetical protein
LNVIESDFWPDLEHRLSRELSQLEDNNLRFLWCDGFLPEETRTEAGFAWITGTAWIEGAGDNRFKFRLRVGPEGTARPDPHSDWSRLLPEENSSGWFSIDLKLRTLEIYPPEHSLNAAAGRGYGPKLNFDFRIDQPLEISDHAGIEVTVYLPSGEKRWCVFMTPAALATCGDNVAGARVHLGERHIMIVSVMSSEVITEVLREIADAGDLELRTLPL